LAWRHRRASASGRQWHCDLPYVPAEVFEDTGADVVARKVTGAEMREPFDVLKEAYRPYKTHTAYPPPDSAREGQNRHEERRTDGERSS
jgi:hypothetical protein